MAPSRRDHLDRRSFMAGSSASLVLAATHGPAAWASLATDPTPPLTSSGAHRLLHLDLETAAPLAEMKTFYGGLLGLETELTEHRLTIRGGKTTIAFTRASSAAPFYHFAFNIPENKILQAREWQLERTPLVPPGDDLRDPAMPADVVHFRHWDAHSIFFWDPAGNFVEYIARHTLGNGAPGPFSTQDILYASEIAFVTADVPATALLLQESLELPQYNGGSERFRAVGDENGLLLVMKQGRIMGFGNGHPIQTQPVHAKIHRGPEKPLEIEGYPFRISG